MTRNSPLLHAFLIAGIAIAAFLPVLEAGFVNLDDDWLLTENLFVRNFTLESVLEILDPFRDRKPLGSEFLPVRDLTYLCEFQLWGDSPRGYHALSLLLHALVALGVYGLARSIHLSPIASTLGALFFAVHPAGSEVVCWISSRKDGLAAVFGLGYLILTRLATKHDSIRMHLGAYLFLLLSLLSKASAVVFPALALVLHFTSPPSTTSYSIRKLRSWAPIALALVLALGAAWGHRTVYAQSDSLGTGIEDTSQRTGLVAPTVLHDLRVALFPVALLAHYRAPDLSTFTQGVCAILVVLLLGIHLYLLRYPFPNTLHPSLPGLWFLCALSPVLAPTSRASAFIADRYLYVPTIGIALGFGYLASQLTVGNRSRLVTGTILIALSLLSLQRTEIWKSSENLWTDALVKAPDNPIVHFNRGTDAYQTWTRTHATEDLEKALFALKRCRDLAPSFVRCHYQLGVIFFHQSTVAHESRHRLHLLGTAIRSIERALDIQPNYVSALTLRASCAMQQGDPDHAEHLLLKALDLNTTSVESNAEMGNLLRHFRKDPRGAALYFEKAAQHTSRPARLLRLAALSQEEAGLIREAIQTLHRAHSLEPTNPRIIQELERLQR